MIPIHTKEIIEFLLRHVHEPGYNVNQLARKLNMSVGNAHKIVTELREKKMLKVLDLKTAIYYSLNLTNPDTLDFCKIILREQQRNLKPQVKPYAEEVKKFDKSRFTIVYGSILIKKNFRDVDVLFITDKVKEVHDFCALVNKIRTKPIDPLIMTEQDFINNIGKKDPVVTDIIVKGIVIKGEDKFMEALRHGQNEEKF